MQLTLMHTNDVNDSMVLVTESIRVGCLYKQNMLLCQGRNSHDLHVLNR